LNKFLQLANAVLAYKELIGAGNMSNRSLLEFNHDFCPHTDEECLAFGRAIATYLSAADERELPKGVVFKYLRHHSTKDPLEGFGTPS
jgi:hypothetical protein